jgi:hypothetical protein
MRKVLEKLFPLHLYVETCGQIQKLSRMVAVQVEHAPSMFGQIFTKWLGQLGQFGYARLGYIHQVTLAWVG